MTDDWVCFICGFVVNGGINDVNAEIEKLEAAIDHLVEEHGWSKEPKRKDTGPNVCPSPTRMRCVDEDGVCRQPDKVYCTCPVVNQRAKEWTDKLCEDSTPHSGPKQ